MGQNMSLSSPPNIPITEDGQEEAPLSPSSGRSAVTAPPCVIHDECETTSSMAVQLPPPSQTQSTEGYFTPPILSGLSAPVSPNTVRVENVESFPSEAESLNEPGLFPVRPGRKEVGSVSTSDSSYELPGPRPDERARIVRR